MADRLSVGQLSTLSFASLFFFFLLCRVKPQARKEAGKQASRQAGKEKKGNVGRERRGEEKKEAEGEFGERERESEVSMFSYVIFDSSGPACMSFFLFSSPPLSVQHVCM
ncbi:hypothetical protein P167DRAFT_46167 [Morchella conica CCBAS932]|uniref:Uncharacterized protein n=1 Tax=Morchella conica CCBAS932 TaxID=1392247 RepID=A0A3N4L2M5_9PEZI|nr:hypothetical protein P167DRAFT_46167 [Morchella conica CCBAS932]